MSDTDTQTEKKKIKVASFWENTDKNGNIYLNGYFNGLPFILFRNTYKKEGDKTPDFNGYIFEKLDNREKVKDDFKKEFDQVPF